MVAAPDSHPLFRPSFNDVQDERNKSCPAGGLPTRCQATQYLRIIPALAGTRPSNQNGG